MPKFPPGESGNPNGRRKGVPNKATAKRQAEIAASGLTPLQYLINRMGYEDAPMSERIDCAKAAAPYVHPRLQAIAHTGTIETKAATENTENLTALERRIEEFTAENAGKKANGRKY